MPKKVPDLSVGDVFGNWTVLEEITGKREKRYLCRCKCGTEKEVTKSNLRLGKSKSCNKGQCKSLATTHGMTDHPLYTIWCGIKSRINNPTGANACYKGVSLDPAWTSFDNFHAWANQTGYCKGLSIDRIDPTGNYSPNNCRWADTLVQSQNRNGHKNAEIPFKGVFKAKPRNGVRIYKGTGKAPFYFIVTYKGKRYQKWGFESAEAAYQAKCQFIEDHFKGLVKP